MERSLEHTAPRPTSACQPQLSNPKFALSKSTNSSSREFSPRECVQYVSSRIREEFAKFSATRDCRNFTAATFFPRRSVAQNFNGIPCASTPPTKGDTKL